MNLLELPAGENLLMSAYRAVTKSAPIAAHSLQAEYENIVGARPLATSPKIDVYDRFCLVDPTLQTTTHPNTLAG